MQRCCFYVPCPVCNEPCRNFVRLYISPDKTEHEKLEKDVKRLKKKLILERLRLQQAQEELQKQASSARNTSEPTSSKGRNKPPRAERSAAAASQKNEVHAPRASRAPRHYWQSYVESSSTCSDRATTGSTRTCRVRNPPDAASVSSSSSFFERLQSVTAFLDTITVHELDPEPEQREQRETLTQTPTQSPTRPDPKGEDYDSWMHRMADAVSLPSFTPRPPTPSSTELSFMSILPPMMPIRNDPPCGGE